MRRTILHIVVLTAVFCLGYFAGITRLPTPVTFHDNIVSHPHELQALVTPDDKRIRALAAELKTPENAYAYVRDRVRNNLSLPALPAGEIIAEGAASCIGKAVLLCSLYRAMGIPASDVRVVTGEVEYPYGVIDHAWIDLEYNDTELEQDATDLIGYFKFDEFHGASYSRSFMRSEEYTFNDKGFAVISPLNLIKGSHPPIQ